MQHLIFFYYFVTLDDGVAVALCATIVRAHVKLAVKRAVRASYHKIASSFLALQLYTIANQNRKVPSADEIDRNKKRIPLAFPDVL